MLIRFTIFVLHFFFAVPLCTFFLKMNILAEMWSTRHELLVSLKDFTYRLIDFSSIHLIHIWNLKEDILQHYTISLKVRFSSEPLFTSLTNALRLRSPCSIILTDHHLIDLHPISHNLLSIN